MWCDDGDGKVLYVQTHGISDPGRSEPWWPLAPAPPSGGSGPLGRSRAMLADVAARLGVVVRVADTPVGPVALYQLDSRLIAACDACPHAGACLSDGPLDATVVTCPAHGSRFDLSNGERIRGPADHDLATYDVLIEGGRVCMSWARALR